LTVRTSATDSRSTTMSPSTPRAPPTARVPPSWPLATDAPPFLNHQGPRVSPPLLVGCSTRSPGGREAEDGWWIAPALGLGWPLCAPACAATPPQIIDWRVGMEIKETKTNENGEILELHLHVRAGHQKPSDLTHRFQSTTRF
jgi:hypothetical protein